MTYCPTVGQYNRAWNSSGREVCFVTKTPNRHPTPSGPAVLRAREALSNDGVRLMAIEAARAGQSLARWCTLWVIWIVVVFISEPR